MTRPNARPKRHTTSPPHEQGAAVDPLEVDQSEVRQDQVGFPAGGTGGLLGDRRLRRLGLRRERGSRDQTRKQQGSGEHSRARDA